MYKYRIKAFFHNTFSFSGELERGEFWSDLAIRFISLLCAAILLCILIVVVVPGDTAYLISLTDMVIPFFAVLWMFPVIPMTRRRLRDAGFSAKSYLWLLLPAVGLIVFAVLLCAKSADGKANMAAHHMK